MNIENRPVLRPECLLPADRWLRPSGVEVRAVLRFLGLTGRSASDRYGLGEKGPRNIRRWCSDGVSDVPYAFWALMCHDAGFGEIWKDS